MHIGGLICAPIHRDGQRGDAGERDVESPQNEQPRIGNSPSRRYWINADINTTNQISHADQQKDENSDAEAGSVAHTQRELVERQYKNQPRKSKREEKSKKVKDSGKPR